MLTMRTYLHSFQFACLLVVLWIRSKSIIHISVLGSLPIFPTINTCPLAHNRLIILENTPIQVDFINETVLFHHMARLLDRGAYDKLSRAVLRSRGGDYPQLQCQGIENRKETLRVRTEVTGRGKELRKRKRREIGKLTEEAFCLETHIFHHFSHIQTPYPLLQPYHSLPITAQLLLTSCLLLLSPLQKPIFNSNAHSRLYSAASLLENPRSLDCSSIALDSEISRKYPHGHG